MAKFPWTPKEQFGDFILTRFDTSEIGDVFNLRNIGTHFPPRKVHPDYEFVLEKTYNSYIPIQGGIDVVHVWRPEDDALYEYIMDNISDIPWQWPADQTTITVDPETRTFIARIDFDAYPNNTWLQVNDNWTWSMDRDFVAYKQGTAMTCVMMEPGRVWAHKRVNLQAGQSITYTRATDIARAVILRNDLEANGTVIQKNEAYNITSNQITFSATEGDTIIAIYEDTGPR